MDDNSDPVAEAPVATLTLGQRVADALSILVKGAVNGISQEDAATVTAHVDAIKAAEDASIANMQEAVAGLSSFEDTLTPEVNTLQATVADLTTRVNAIEAELDTLPGALDGLVATDAATSAAPAPTPPDAPADPVAEPVAAEPTPVPADPAAAPAPDAADPAADGDEQTGTDAGAPAAGFGQSGTADPATGT